MRVGIAGAAGKMGQALIKSVKEHPELTLGAAWERPDHPSLGQDAGLLAGQDRMNIILSDDMRSALSECEVVIDFTAPKATMTLVEAALPAGRSLVIGTTGFSAHQLSGLQEAARKISVVYATNFSIGINLLWVLARRAAEVLGPRFDAEIIEAHHNMKKDAPSGTALTLLEAICKGQGLDPDKCVRHGRQGWTGPRSPGEVGMHAVRAGDIIGEHLALFAGPGERLELKHQAHSRDTFARGAVRAAAWLGQRPAGFYHMADVLGLEEK